MVEGFLVLWEKILLDTDGGRLYKHTPTSCSQPKWIAAPNLPGYPKEMGKAC